ncbi:MAG TPA: MFS transporter [Thermoplasmata archaeon]|nr:MFS transporter [Thermoplasmata archaeon]
MSETALRAQSAPASPTADGETAPSTPMLSSRRTLGVLVALMMGLLLGALDNFIVVTALPTIARDLNDQAGQVFVVSSYLIAQTVAIPVFGKLSDRFGRRSFYLLGLAIFLGGSALSGFSQSLNQLILFRAIQGLGSGAFFTVVFSIVADIFPPKAAARLAGMLSGVFGIAIVFGPLIGSYIIDTTTWRWIFFVNLPVGFAAIALVLATLSPLKPERVALRFDTVGTVLLSGWVGALIFALVETSNGWAWTDPRTLGLLAIALVLLPIFLVQEYRAQDPILPLQYFRQRLVAASSAVNFLRGALLVGVVTFIPILVVFGLGGSADASRDILYAFMVPMIFGAALGGQLVSKSGFRVPVVLGLALVLVGVFLLTLVPTTPPLFRFVGGFLPVGLAGALIPFGFGVGLTFAPTQLSIQYSVPKSEVGTGNSLVWFLSNLGGSIVVSILGTFQLTWYTNLKPSGAPPAQGTPAFFAYVGQIEHALAVSIQDVWWALVPIALAGLAAALLVSGQLPKAEGEPIEQRSTDALPAV